MSSAKFMKIAKRIVKEEPQLFETLMEFEKTKRIRTKERLNFTIDKSLASNFRKFCREQGYNMSLKIEQAIKQMMQKKPILQ